MGFCRTQKCLDEKTLKAYRIDLRQFTEQIHATEIAEINSSMLEEHIATLHRQYQPKTAKRKIASLKAFFHFLEYKDLIEYNPFDRIQVHFREPVKLPKTIPLNIIETFLTTIYTQYKNAGTAYKKRNALRDAAVIELLFSSGMRISELCELQADNVNLYDGTILIYGKGDKERRIQIGNESVIRTLTEYCTEFTSEIANATTSLPIKTEIPYPTSPVRRMINKYSDIASINMHITPHMFSTHLQPVCLRQM